MVLDQTHRPISLYRLIYEYLATTFVGMPQAQRQLMIDGDQVRENEITPL